MATPRRGRGRGRKVRTETNFLSIPDYVPKLSQTEPKTSNPETLPAVYETAGKRSQGSYSDDLTWDDNSSACVKEQDNADSGIGQLCVVCGENASGQYFGAVVCLPCKSFYIRCTKDGDPVFHTRCNGTCDVTKKSRIRCQACRFQKCLRAGMSRREKPERVDPEEGQYLCQVCGDLANGIHFGVFTCEGCKKFFRRGLIENKSYICKGSNTCVMNPRSRNACRACRYLKCINVGMSREAIKMGRPKKKDGFSPRPMPVTSRPQDRNQDSLDIVLMGCNESDSTEEVEMIEIPVKKKKESQKSLSEISPLPSSVVESPTGQLTTTSPKGIKRRSSEDSWKSLSVHKATFTASKATSYSVKNSSTFPSTVTSSSEYTEFTGRKVGEGYEEMAEKRIHIKPSLGNCFPSSEMTLIQEMQISRREDSGETNQPESDESAVYSLSNEDIDSMLKLLDDFEKPKSALSNRRRTQQGFNEENRAQPKRMKYDVESTNQNQDLNVKIGPQLSDNHSSHNQITQSYLPLKEDSFKDANDHELCKQIPNPYPESRYGSQIEDFSNGQLKRHEVYPHNESSCNQFGGNPSGRASQCNCRCWTKITNRVQPHTVETFKKMSCTTTNLKIKGEPTPHTPQNHSIQEISKAFEVLYDKLGHSGVAEGSPIGDKMKSGTTTAALESWWDVDMDCTCIQVTGGLCMCENPPESKKIAGQCLEIGTSSSLVDAQQHLLQQLIEACLVSVSDTPEKTTKDESRSITEIVSMLRA